MDDLYWGDNLGILRDHVTRESVDLIYLDPPFNSNRNYNGLFSEVSHHESEAQIEVFAEGGIGATRANLPITHSSVATMCCRTSRTS